jgi:hypothetical protein
MRPTVSFVTISRRRATTAWAAAKLASTSASVVRDCVRLVARLVGGGFGVCVRLFELIHWSWYLAVVMPSTVRRRMA